MLNAAFQTTATRDQFISISVPMLGSQHRSCPHVEFQGRWTVTGCLQKAQQSEADFTLQRNKGDEFRCCPKDSVHSWTLSTQAHPELSSPEVCPADWKIFLLYGFCQFMSDKLLTGALVLTHFPGNWKLLLGLRPLRSYGCSADIQNSPDQPLFVNGIPDAVFSVLIQYIQALSVRVLHLKYIPYILPSAFPDLLVLSVLFLDLLLAQSSMPTCSE